MSFYRETVGHICSLYASQLAKKKHVSGIIFSNTCDAAYENKRELPTNIVFAPVMKLASYITLLERAGLDKEKIKK